LNLYPEKIDEFLVKQAFIRAEIIRKREEQLLAEQEAHKEQIKKLLTEKDAGLQNL